MQSRACQQNDINNKNAIAGLPRTCKIAGFTLTSPGLIVVLAFHWAVFKSGWLLELEETLLGSTNSAKGHIIVYVIVGGNSDQGL